MSRSNPTDQGTHPCSRWHEWDGSVGVVRYYDKQTNKDIPISGDFVFILLDQLSVIKGWHDASNSGITSNEVRDTTTDPFVVRAFSSGVLASGIYQAIREKIISVGGHFTTNCYIAYKDGAVLSIGSLQLKGAALNAWVEFKKKHRAELYTKAIKISGYEEGKKGKITFRMPKFSVVDISPDTNEKALALDTTLQLYLDRYLSKPKQEQAEAVPAPSSKQVEDERPPEVLEAAAEQSSEDDVPF
jgi:hypothetical protein